MTDAATLMFGLGATRAGSTWLYRYLAEHPDCAVPRVKELHYFKVMEEGGEDRQIARLNRVLERIALRRLERSDDETPQLDRWQADVEGLISLFEQGENIEAYLSYLREGRDGQVMVDITPAYALLSVDRLEAMAKLTPDVKFVYLLRDPVDRLWSNLRQTAKIKAAKDVANPSEDLIGRHLERLFDRTMGGLENGVLRRSDYKGILTRLGRAFPREQLFVTYYERLFQDDTLAELCDFLGIAPRPGNYGHRANEAVSIKMTPSQRAKAAREMETQYDFVDQYMSGDLPQRWQDNRPAPRRAEMKV